LIHIRSLQGKSDAKVAPAVGVDVPESAGQRW
jgi:hypothetical protein